MATVTGAMLTTNILSDQLALDFGDEIALLDPKENPFTLFTRMADKRRTVSYTYSHFEDRRKARFDSTSGTATTTIQTIPVATGASFQQWDLVQNTGPARFSASTACPATTSPSPATSRRPASAPAPP
jgi:hypothetical protein